MLSQIRLFVTPGTIAHQAPLFMGFPRQEHSIRLPFPTPGHLPDPGIKPTSLVSPALAGRFFTIVPPGKPVFLTPHLYLATPTPHLLKTSCCFRWNFPEVSELALIWAWKGRYISIDKEEEDTSLVVQWLKLCLPVQRAWFWSLVRELRSHMPHGQKKPKTEQNIKHRQYYNKFNKDIKNGPH